MGNDATFMLVLALDNYTWSGRARLSYSTRRLYLSRGASGHGGRREVRGVTR